MAHLTSGVDIGYWAIEGLGFSLHGEEFGFRV